jgi:quercetin dioxygenase-like cupin family protein
MTAAHEPAKGTAASTVTHFTGAVDVRSLRRPDDESALTLYEVTFVAGARTYWHTHPRGQGLYVTAGRARVQIEGQAATDYETGEYVWIPAQTRHWHGATPDAPMTHLAAQEATPNGRTAAWCEPVTDSTFSPTEHTDHH